MIAFLARLPACLQIIVDGSQTSHSGVLRPQSSIATAGPFA